jgi:tetratricopeptide (TPR) repeat protein
MNATPETLPKVPLAPATRSRKPFLIAIGLVIVLFAGTYAFSWFRSLALSSSYLAAANESYDNGDYLQALTGFRDFDEDLNRYVTRGGYFQVERIWASAYAWPVPDGVQTARERIDEIVNQRITIRDAEQFIQVNTGRGNPYMGVIYLRLGELYEAEGDERSARDIYESIPELFPNETGLIERAQDHLTRLEASN